jgi:hypothetical protein
MQAILAATAMAMGLTILIMFATQDGQVRTLLCRFSSAVQSLIHLCGHQQNESDNSLALSKLQDKLRGNWQALEGGEVQSSHKSLLLLPTLLTVEMHCLQEQAGEGDGSINTAGDEPIKVVDAGSSTSALSICVQPHQTAQRSTKPAEQMGWNRTTPKLRTYTACWIERL